MNLGLLPLTRATHLSAVMFTNVGSSLRSCICIGACITHCQDHHLLISNAIPIDFSFHVSFEAYLLWITYRAPRNWYYCETLPSIFDEDIEAIFCALVDNVDFKVCFRTLVFITINMYWANKWKSSLKAWDFVHGRIWCVTWFHVNRDEFVDLCNAKSLIKG